MYADNKKIVLGRKKRKNEKQQPKGEKRLDAGQDIARPEPGPPTHEPTYQNKPPNWRASVDPANCATIGKKGAECRGAGTAAVSPAPSCTSAPTRDCTKLTNHGAQTAHRFHTRPWSTPCVQLCSDTCIVQHHTTQQEMNKTWSLSSNTTQHSNANTTNTTACTHRPH